MVDAFGEISFLTRSENRVEVLDCLAEGAYTERELVDETGVSDVTIGRITEAFAERGWIREVDDGFTTTPIGNQLAADYARFRDSMDVACRLGPVRDLLPTVEMADAFELRRLADARITDPETFDTFRTVDRWIELIRGSDHIRVVGPSGSTMSVVAETVHEEVVERGMGFEAVLGPAYFEPPRGRPDLRSLHGEMIEAGADLYRMPEDADEPPCVAVYDDLAAVAGFDDSGSMRVGIESHDEVVYEWVEDTITRYREAATRLTAEEFRE